ncbi:MAG: tetratricopeptide repeat protein [Bryobacterales bacterium]|nr:tetratricopeptide repeat protein [Bryobacterales bacterium]
MSSGPGDSTLLLPDEDRPRPVAPVVAGPEIPGFRVVGRLGEGGMGAVYEAEQEQPQRRVALKLLASGFSDDEYRRRLFRREVEMLARLQHPSIAAIYGCGETSAGQAYFAMELVRGARLGAGNGHLPVERRLKVFLEICDAVDHAHRQGIIHRDLKPANIMLDAVTGHVKVLDFGLARALEAEQDDLTRPGMVMGTVRYMSPEQASGQRVAGTGSDQYALGVILYELLTGRMPYALDNLSLPAAARVIEEKAPEPSGLPEDLDVIVRKALAKDPAQRYAGVAALAEDLRRYQRREPVLARRPSAWYLLQRFVQRHRLPAGLALFSLLVLVGAVVALGVANRRTAAERDRAEQVSAFLRDIFENTNPNRGSGERITARELLDNGARRIESSLANQPELRADLESTIGEAYRRLGLADRALPLLRRVLEDQKRLHGNSSREVAAATFRLGDGLAGAGRAKEAEPVLADAVARLRKVTGAESVETAAALHAQALVLVDNGRRKEVMPLITEALRIRQARLGPEHDDTLTSRMILGSTLRALGDFAAAEAELRQAYQLRRQRLGVEHLGTASAGVRLMQVYLDTYRWQEAETLAREVLATRRARLGAENPLTAAAQSDLASILQDSGKYQEAERLYREALGAALRTAPQAHATSVSMNNLASLLEDTGRFAEAAELYRQSLAIRRITVGEESLVYLRVVDNLARAELGRGQLGECGRLLRLIAEKGTGRLTPQEMAAAEMTEGRLLQRLGKFDESEARLRHVVEVYQKMRPSGSIPLARGQAALGALLLEGRRPAEALPLLESAWSYRQKVWGAANRYTQESRADLDRCQAQLAKR